RVGTGGRIHGLAASRALPGAPVIGQGTAGAVAEHAATRGSTLVVAGVARVAGQTAPAAGSVRFLTGLAGHAADRFAFVATGKACSGVVAQRVQRTVAASRRGAVGAQAEKRRAPGARAAKVTDPNRRRGAHTAHRPTNGRSRTRASNRSRARI